MPDAVYRVDASIVAPATSTPGGCDTDPYAPRSIRARSSAGDVQIEARR